MKQFFLCITLFLLGINSAFASDFQDPVEQSIQAMIQNVDDYTLNALGEQTQLAGIEELNALKIRTLDLQSKIKAMEPTQNTTKYLSMIDEVLTSIDENIKKLESSIDRDVEKLVEDLQKIELTITKVNHISPQEDTILSIYEGKKVECTGIEELLKAKYSLFAWNSCSSDANELLSYIISVENNNYNYELLHIKFQEGIQSIKSIESGSGVTQATILEKNITLRNVPEYAQYIASLRTQTTPSQEVQIPQNPENSQENTASGEIVQQDPIVPSSQVLEGGFQENYTGEKVGCESAQTLANQRYGWAAWNRCEVKNNILTIYVLGLVDESKQTYIYEKNTINFSTGIRNIEFLESGVGINKDNLIEKNREFRTKY